MASLSGNPTTFSAGATTITLNHAIRAVELRLLQPSSATAATARVTDLNGNLLLPELTCGATIGASSVWTGNQMIPGGPNAAGVVGATATTNPMTVSVAGAGALAMLSYR